jgi:hypothetical protein
MLEWYLATTPAKLVAREMLSVAWDQVSDRVAALSILGAPGWAWLDQVDTAMAAAAEPRTIETYRGAAQYAVTATDTDPAQVADYSHRAKQLERWSTVQADDAARSPASIKAAAAALRARKAAFIAGASVLEIEETTHRAGFPPHEQLEWILDKPGLKPLEFREITTVWPAGTSNLPSPATITKLRARFPHTQPEELFGELPIDLIQLGAQDPRIGSWLLAGSEPEAILRLVTFYPDLITAWCATLTSSGVGYGWVHQLGGRYDDHLLRRFVLKCPDKAVVEYIENRVLGDAEVPGKTIVAPEASPDAYSSNRSHLDADLKDANKQLERRANKPPTPGEPRVAPHTSEQTDDIVATDVDQLTGDELIAVRGDATRLKQILQTADAKTFARLIDRLQPALPVVIAFAEPTSIVPAHLISWIQTRPASEVAATLANPMQQARAQALFDGLGPFEVFPQLAAPAVLAPVLRSNPEIAEWLMASDPLRVIHAIAAPAVIDLAVHALAPHADLIADNWPTAVGMAAAERGVVVQLVARASGALRGALQAKLETKNLDPDDATPADTQADAVRSNAPLVATLERILQQDAAVSSILALCRAHVTEWHDLATDKDLVAALYKHLELPPDVVFPGLPLHEFMITEAGRDWVLSTVPAFKVLASVSGANEQGLASTLDSRNEPGHHFIKSLPRGRALSAPARATLRGLSTLVEVPIARQLFGVRFDVEIEATYPADELQRLWSVLELVPSAHVDQHSISGFRNLSGGGAGATAGVYYPDTTDVALKKDLHRETNPSPEYDRTDPLTEAQAIDTLGSKEALDRFVGEKRMIRNDDGTFEFVQQNPEQFTSVVLHEVGHAVDAMLGGKTELIYGLAGWKRFAAADFDGWAADLGGWSDVSATDQQQIRKVWISWLNSGGRGGVNDMVASDHPAVAERYHHVGVVQLARDGSRPMLGHAVVIGNRTAMTRHSSQEFLSLSPKAYHGSPSAYALTSPEEYFAECYSNYYREFNGTPETAPRKGASLVPWIKQWFDTNIDTVGHNPKRNPQR